MAYWQPKPEKFLSKEELKRLREFAEARCLLDLQYGRFTYIQRYALIEILSLTGARINEVRLLKVKDLGIESREPYVDIKHGKGNKGRRVYIPRKLCSILKRYLKQRSLHKKPIEQNSYLLSGKKKPCAKSSLQRSFKKALKEAGLPEHFSCHSLRHTYASNLLEQANNLQYLRAQLGHENLQTTSVYAHLINKEKLCKELDSLYD